MTSCLGALATTWRARADELELLAATAQATTLRWAAAQLEAAIAQADDELLTLEQAAALGHYSAEHLRKLVADGSIPNAGKRGAPRIRRRDVPVRAPKPSGTAGGRPAGYDPAQDAIALVGRLRRGA